MTDPADDAVAAQYEAYPYPARDARDEAKRLILGSPSFLAEIDHWVFAARSDPARPLAVLVAGGGTGDGLVMLAQQMEQAGRPGHITYLDRSAAAAAIARKRIAARGLGHRVTFVQGSLLDASRIAPGPFDYIDCCGVLHHLPDPAAGLAAIAAVLAPGGGMGLMVYAPHGRAGVYMLQEALATLAPASEPLPARIEAARRLVRGLHPGHPLGRGAFRDHLDGGDSGLVDLLLHPRDRPYTVTQLIALLAGAGLHATTLVEPLRYDPATYASDPKLRARAAALPWAERAALAEALSGTMVVHIAYAVRRADGWTAPDPSDERLIPTLRDLDGKALAASLGPGQRIGLDLDGVRTQLVLPPLGPALLARIDGRRSIGAVLDAVGASAGQPGAGRDRAARDWAALYATLNAANKLLLAAPPGG
ncbi:bifunctional 2-polyprenyl-6-hydroxyphenol methylase/3-demethylubiquinol 3-O-methyltransferase UbiG [Elioraea sp.]|uniref:class I SAM-dependent methyltransferase n=1 Tax=Elioraea sp. TaxID=2185103 RepID=UPI0025BA3E1F|nr:class I SAM-dependent methyltransferase [Elioraea sp.]